MKQSVKEYLIELSKLAEDARISTISSELNPADTASVWKLIGHALAAKHLT